MSDAEPLESLIRDERWREQALAQATDPPPAPVPEGETSAARLTREWREQAEAERRDEALERRVMFENPGAPTADALGDPLRELAAGQRVSRRRRRRRGRIP